MRGVTCKFLYILHQFCKFQSTLPGRERRLSVKCSTTSTHFNPHSPCGERLQPFRRVQVLRRISIHTPHAGSDPRQLRPKTKDFYFNPHSPCGERPWVQGICKHFLYFNPHSPCGERHLAQHIYPDRRQFQSTLPMRGATVHASDRAIDLIISIHTPHAGSDSITVPTTIKGGISIHTPHAGSDQQLPGSRAGHCAFQSTLPMRGATFRLGSAQGHPQDFNPHSPCGERRIRRRHGKFCTAISIHTPHAGSDSWR